MHRSSSPVPRTFSLSDLQGVWTANEMHAVPLERPEDLGAPGALSDEAAAARREAAHGNSRSGHLPGTQDGGTT